MILSWPNKALSPNARIHWAQKAKAVKAYRYEAAWVTKAEKLQKPEGMITLELIFRPPSRRRYDLDNCIAMMKGALDGIADGMGVDDSRFRLNASMGEPVKGGQVCVIVRS